MTSGSRSAPLVELTCDELSELAGLYVLDALEPAEREQVRAHLATCAEAHAEIRELGGVIPALASLPEPIESPPDLKARVMAAVAAEPRSAAVATPVADSVAARRQRPVFGEPLQLPARAAWRPAAWASWGAAVAAVLVLAVVGVWALGIQARADETARRDAILSEAVAAFSQSGSSVAVLRPSGTGTTSGSGFAAVTADGKAYVVMVGLPEAPTGMTYQAWFIHDNQPISAGLMTVDQDGYAVMTNASPPAGIQVVALTVEAAGGSEQPTSDPFALGEVRSV